MSSGLVPTSPSGGGSWRAAGSNASSVERVVEQLIAWRRAAGSPSYAEIARRVRAYRVESGLSPAASEVAKSTVYDHFRADRRRLDIELVVDIARALGLDDGEARHWEEICWAVQHRVEASRVVTVRDTLPAPVAPFVGRDTEIAEIVAAGPVVSAIVGMAGAGKTQLAVHVAHRLIDEEAVDRVVFADLSGFDRERPPADPEALVDAVARTLGVQPRQLPDDAADRRQTLGRHLAAKRALLVLDDAAGPEQVAAILPDQPELPILVTSRVAFPDEPTIVSVPLGSFTDDEAVQLLGAGTGPHAHGRVGADPSAASELARLVGHLPLALGIVASRIAARPTWTLADHVRSIEQHHDQLRLDESLRVAIDLSYEALSEPSRRALRLLATQPCADLSRDSVAALVDEPAIDSNAIIDELVAAHMVTITSGDRIGLHALVRAHAAATSVDEDRPVDRDVARARLDEHMVARTWAAVRATPRGHALDQRYAVSREVDPPNLDAAARWLDLELENLLKLSEIDRNRARATTAIELSEALGKHLEVRGRFHEAIILHERALATARMLSDRCGEGRAELYLGQAYIRIGEIDRALPMLERAYAVADELDDTHTTISVANALAIIDVQTGRLERALDRMRASVAAADSLGADDRVAAGLDNIGVVLRRLGDLGGAADHHRRAHAYAAEHGVDDIAAFALMNLSDVVLAQGDAASALDLATDARELARRAGLPPTEASATSNIGLALAALGRPEEAIPHHEVALTTARDTGYRWLETGIGNDLGLALVSAGRAEEAVSTLRAVRDLTDELDDVFERARADAGLARAALLVGDVSTARERWEAALTVFDELGAPEAAEVRGALDGLHGP